MGSVIIQTKPYKPDHFQRLEIEATRVYRLWYPRPKPSDSVSENPVLAERVFQLLEEGYTVAELNSWFRLKKNLRGRTRSNSANVIWEDIKACYNYRCAYCGEKTDLTKDHLSPVSRGGKDAMYNIVPACTKCNSSKKDRNVLDWNRFHRVQLHLLGFESS